MRRRGRGWETNSNRNQNENKQMSAGSTVVVLEVEQLRSSEEFTPNNTGRDRAFDRRLVFSVTCFSRNAKNFFFVISMLSEYVRRVSTTKACNID